MRSMQVLTEAQVAQVYALTDSLKLNPDWVVVPLTAHETGMEMMFPDGKILIRPAGGEAFEPWFADLRTRLESMDIARALRASQLERHYTHTPAEAPPGSGSRRYVPWNRSSGNETSGPT